MSCHIFIFSCDTAPCRMSILKRGRVVVSNLSIKGHCRRPGLVNSSIYSIHFFFFFQTQNQNSPIFLLTSGLDECQKYSGLCISMKFYRNLHPGTARPWPFGGHQTLTQGSHSNCFTKIPCVFPVRPPIFHVPI